ncbi:hypothetical protein [Streptomyces sp. NRRL S-237]|uniref:hypothetical protein n=1 Tax=Streptomyces sp. NRRL S-237 TaxID=1463895 RepID=UPI00131C3232|nr:hypothetical protein [Streptomyces sp. NRRL S-237]
MIENGNQLGAATAQIGPSPTGTPACVWSLDPATDTSGKHHGQGADHGSARRPPWAGPALTDHHDHSHHQEREQPT